MPQVTPGTRVTGCHIPARSRWHKRTRYFTVFPAAVPRPDVLPQEPHGDIRPIRAR